jgi:hypothetical protein
VGVVSVGRPRDFSRWRKQLTSSLGHLPDLTATAQSAGDPVAVG